MNHIIFDLEATSWEDRNLPADKEIIEIAAVQLDDKLEPKGEFDSFVRPLENPLLSAFCSELTRIKQYRVAARADSKGAERRADNSRGWRPAAVGTQPTDHAKFKL